MRYDGGNEQHRVPLFLVEYNVSSWRRPRHNPDVYAREHKVEFLNPEYA